MSVSYITTAFSICNNIAYDCEGKAS